MKIGRFVPIVIALLATSWIARGVDDPYCQTPGRKGKSPTTGQQLACLVTRTFYANHFASTITDAKTKALARGESSTFIPVLVDNLTSFKTIAGRVGRSRPSTFLTWYCTYKEGVAPAKATASCATSRQTLYFCVDRNNRVFHLDSDPTVTVCTGLD